jgi:hypothetical protein
MRERDRLYIGEEEVMHGIQLDELKSWDRYEPLNYLVKSKLYNYGMCAIVLTAPHKPDPY